jgi:hypothetical protein
MAPQFGLGSCRREGPRTTATVGDLVGTTPGQRIPPLDVGVFVPIEQMPGRISTLRELLKAVSRAVTWVSDTARGVSTASTVRRRQQHASHVLSRMRPSPHRRRERLRGESADIFGATTLSIPPPCAWDAFS